MVDLNASLNIRLTTYDRQEKAENQLLLERKQVMKPRILLGFDYQSILPPSSAFDYHPVHPRVGSIHPIQVDGSSHLRLGGPREGTDNDFESRE